MSENIPSAGQPSVGPKDAVSRARVLEANNKCRKDIPEAGTPAGKAVSTTDLHQSQVG